MVNANHPPILVTGAPRSGTTFLGKMLSLHSSVAYIDEPFNLETGIKGIDRHLAYITKKQTETEQYYAELLQSLLQGKSAFKQSDLRSPTDSVIRQTARQLFVSRENLGYKLNARNPLKSRRLLKDPMACFASEYLHRELGAKTVVILRHPASTIASYKRLGWHFDLNDLLSQPELMKDHLEPILGRVNIKKLNPVQEWAYFWLAIHAVLDTFLKCNAAMLKIRHEDLSLKPLHHLHWLYEKLELPFTSKVKQKIIDHTNIENPAAAPDNAPHVLKRHSASVINQWRKILTPEEIAQIKEIVSPFSQRWYTDREW